MSDNAAPTASLVHAEFLPDAKGSVILQLADAIGRQAAFRIGPYELGGLLQRFMGMAVTWSEDPDLNIKELTGRNNCLPAQKMAVFEGKHQQEAIVSLGVGSFELCFTLPVPKLVEAVESVDQRVKYDPDLEPGKGPSSH